MTEATIEPRVRSLEDLMSDLLRATTRTQESLDQLSREMREFKDETRTSNREMNKRWGELANKMGTMAKDWVAPSIPRILRTTTGCSADAIERTAVRLRQRHPEMGQMQEFDVVAVCDDYVLINETKSRLDAEDVTEFVELLTHAREYFPEYADRRFIGAIASLYVDTNVVQFGEKHGIIMLGSGQELLDVLNSPEFAPREF